MIVEHITALSGHSLDRNTKSILAQTVEHFRAFQIKDTAVHLPVGGTPLTCRATSAEGIALFDLYQGPDIIVANVCNFVTATRSAALRWTEAMAQRIPFTLPELREPKRDAFLYTFVLNPFTPPHIATLCGEIELYIWHALYLGSLSRAT